MANYLLDTDDPRNVSAVKGEPPYGINLGDAVDRIRKKLGPANIQGIIGALTMPTGIIDRSGQRQGPSDFQAGLLGFQGGYQGYEQRQQKYLSDLAAMNLKERAVGAAEQQAEAAQTRADAYGRYVGGAGARKSMTPEERYASRLKWFQGLSPEEIKAARVAGLIPRDPNTAGKVDNEDLYVQGLVAQYPGMTPEEARVLVRSKPILLGTTGNMGYDKVNRRIIQTSDRKYGYPAVVKMIMQRHGIDPNTWVGVPGGSEAGTFPTGPQSPEEVDPEDMDQLENWLNDPDLSDIQAQWIKSVLDSIMNEPDSTAVPR